RCWCISASAAVLLRFVSSKPVSPLYSRPSSTYRQWSLPPARVRSPILSSLFALQQEGIQGLLPVQDSPPVRLDVARALALRAPVPQRVHTGADVRAGLCRREQLHAVTSPAISTSASTASISTGSERNSFSSRSRLHLTAPAIAV